MRSCADILPVEIWDLVIGELALQLEYLLTLAKVCRVFNQLCIARYLLGYGVSAESLAAGSIEIDQGNLPALLVSRSAPPLRWLCCRGLGGNQVLRNFERIKTILNHSPALCRLSLAFRYDLLKSFHDTHRPSEKSLLVALCGLMHAMSSKIAGPVVIMSEGSLFRCTPEDILRWQLHDAGEKPFISKAASKFLRRPIGISSYAIIRDEHEQPIKVKPITSIGSISICSIPSLSGSFQSCTFIVFNSESAHSLYLGRTGTALAAHSISSPELTALLPHITLPALRDVHLNTTTIEPAVLADFLLRHPSIVSFAYDPPEAEPRPSILSPPIAHPALACIRVMHSSDVVAVLDSVGRSPALQDIAFRYDHNLPSAALRRIALQPRDTALQLTLGPPARRGALDKAEIALAESLRCIVRITVDCASVSDARALLPWLNKLPELQRVEFRSARGIFRWGAERRDPHADTVRFLEDAMAGLPRVAEVLVREIPVVIG
ncbi:hypothetical protein MVEN_01420700 [Mycena venus]|uniref:F-box domain-containing protein n=1 Tax=Mycena venus TaxID=2733690 RepID=A0A8H6XZ15_9AGAR|nr:hypothetical protein MVEN_01420700 [Mycena venus]